MGLTHGGGGKEDEESWSGGEERQRFYIFNLKKKIMSLFINHYQLLNFKWLTLVI